jgi:putative spermidine/putrescine transport system substrate-binding protein/putrescine transport system substrate-binding protein
MRLLKSVVPLALATLFSAVAQAQPQVSVCGFLDTQKSKSDFIE